MRVFRSLSDFYTSDEWKRFRASLIFERTKRDGDILKDEYSGEPIYNEYDIIAHHVKELTLQNVNDPSISLNPDNILLVSHRSHNAIHARFGYESGKKVYVVYGAPCSGKTTYINSVKGNSDLVVDIDNIWQALTGGERYYKPNALKSNVFSIYRTLLDQVKTRQGKWERAYIATGMARKGERERLVKELGAEEIFVNTSELECLQRLSRDKERESVQEEWQRYIKEWFINCG